MLLKVVKRIVAIGAVAFIFTLYGAFQSYSAVTSYRVDSVVDGDTIKLSNGRFVRYLGIDTPEVRKREGRGWKYSPEVFALEAKKFNQIMVSGQTVTLEFDRRKQDKYGRWLAYVYVRDILVNEEILRRGLAMFTLYPPNCMYVDRLISAQEEARREQRGLWRDCPVISAADASEYVGRVVSVRGKVFSVGVGKSSCFLNFDKGRKEDLTAVIWKSNIPFFVKDGVAVPDNFRGKMVELTGKMKLVEGPEIVVFHPSQIKFIEE